MRAALLVRVLFAALVVAGCSDASGAAPPTPTACDDCHMSDFRSAPKHVGQKPTKCAVCHASYAWHPQRVDHPFFPLDGAHAKASCFDCHRGNPPQFGGTPKECVGCHRADYDKSRFPGHSSFPLTCEKCHSVSAWKPTLPSLVLPESEQAETPTPQPKQGKSTPKPPEPRPRASAPPPARTAPPAPQHAPAPYTPPPTSPSRPRPDGVSGASKHR